MRIVDNNTAAKKLNDLPNGWEVANLEDVVDISDSKRVPVNAKERANRVGPIPYYGATGQVGWIDDFLLRFFNTPYTCDGVKYAEKGLGETTCPP